MKTATIKIEDKVDKLLAVLDSDVIQSHGASLYNSPRRARRELGGEPRQTCRHVQLSCNTIQHALIVNLLAIPNVVEFCVAVQAQRHLLTIGPHEKHRRPGAIMAFHRVPHSTVT